MQKQLSRMRSAIIWMILFYGMASLSLFFLSLMPVLNEKTQTVLGYTVAIVFWSGMLLGSAILVILSCLRRKLKKRVKGYQQRLPGIVSYTKERFHIVLYITILIGMTLMVSDIVHHWISSYVMFPIISITLFLFIIHCIIDGRNYKIYKLLKEGANDELAN